MLVIFCCNHICFPVIVLFVFGFTLTSDAPGVIHRVIGGKRKYRTAWLQYPIESKYVQTDLFHANVYVFHYFLCYI